ncbi:hypothetical protein P691DRAFT_774756 [Macrolepiota fuliginosa MF-IS2]|uniref:FAD-binding FR-type domain-containing protein n=1 Tax=Macrolepiota fuliginosa MF-IS2 TaxID=1400762 RepID=A0A9P6C288_9AGAR|nr:hypothetical protein P691DRAFT_774756 [Macrolepiota fuliginosa MF-IS2]
MSATSDCALNGWHPGEVIVQGIMNLPARVAITAVVNHLPDQHRLFHTTRLHFLPVTTLDEHGRPWVTILTSKDGNPQFISSPAPTNIHIQAHLWDSDPIIHNLINIRGGSSRQAFISALGIEVSTRRRNKFAGSISSATLEGKALTMELDVNQALGLCPKYINLRKIECYPQANPRTIHDKRELQPNERLPQDVIDFINNADTAYLGTSYVARPEDEKEFPSHVGTNHRGGRPGFVRVRVTDGRTLVLPNYAGNRLMNSMGNIQVTPLAALTFPSFATGSILYITGDAKNLFGEPAREIMPESNVLTTIKVTGYAFVHDALPLREVSDNTVTRSPYSPPVRYLAEENPPENRYGDIILTLRSARIHNDTLATFTFESSRAIEIAPSRNVVLELSEFLRVRSHQILDWVEGKSTENDDCVRTWTVSIPPTQHEPRCFSITVRQIKGGLITPIMYQIVNKASDGRSINQDIPLSSYNIVARLRGIGGDLPIPDPIANCDGGRRLLWVAGGIGVTPFLSLARYVSQWVALGVGSWDIVLVLSTREPDAVLLLISEALRSLEAAHDLTDFAFALYLFTPSPGVVRTPQPWSSTIDVHIHQGRLAVDGSFFSQIGAKDREPHICGPLPFVLTAMKAMTDAGVNPEHVKRERFTY